ncbi:hypothetical protein ACSBR2_012338 [Camellia fascicularis]
MKMVLASASSGKRFESSAGKRIGTKVTNSGERKREEEKDGAKYFRMERRVRKLMRKFLLLENVNTDQIFAVCQDGVLTEFLWSRISLERNSKVQRKLVKT